MKISRKLYHEYGTISYIMKPEYFAQKFIHDVIWQVDNLPNHPAIFLTFDDGPHPTRTPRVMDILDEFDVKATFFFVGKNIEKYPEIVKEVSRRGHAIANHTFSHKRLIRMSDSEMLDEISKVEDLYSKLKVPFRKLLRPPFGLISKSQIALLKEYGYQIVIGNVYPRDSNAAKKQEILSRVINDISNGSIIILHDGVVSPTPLRFRRSTLFVIDDLIENIKKEGFQPELFPMLL